jgi:hypothetical protein
MPSLPLIPMERCRNTVVPELLQGRHGRSSRTGAPNGRPGRPIALGVVLAAVARTPEGLREHGPELEDDEEENGEEPEERGERDPAGDTDEDP